MPDMKETVKQIAALCGSTDSKVVGIIIKHVPNKDVPDAMLRKVLAIGRALKKAGVK